MELNAQQGLIRGRIIEAGTDRGVRASVTVHAEGVPVRAVDDSVFRLVLPAGAFSLQVRSVGFDPVSLKLMLAAGDTVDFDVELERRGVALAPIVTRADGIPTGYESQLADFVARRRIGLGRFLDWRYFERNADRRLSSVLGGVFPGLRIVRRGAKEIFVTQRVGSECLPQLVVNGVVSADDDVSLVNTSEVLAFEYHTSATAPLAYNGTTVGRGPGAVCGTVLLWLR